MSKRIDTFPEEDAVSNLLKSLRVRSSVFCVANMGAPWGFVVQARDVASFHLVVEGDCWVQVDGTDPLRLDRGDLVLVPHGDAHAVRDDPTTPVTALDDLLVESPQDGWRVGFGGDGARTELLCGTLRLENGNGLLRSLPPVIRVPGRRGRPADRLAPSIALLRSEMPAGAAGAEEVVTRATDVLIAQAIRSWLLAREPAWPPLPALRDPQILRAIDLVDASPGEDWTVTRLAQAVAMSRSSFSARFTALVGLPPMKYVTQRRLSTAADLLRAASTVSEAATASGYRSLGAFNRAFKNSFGVAPGAYRRAG